MGIPRRRSACSCATVVKCRRGMTAPYSNQKSNRSPLMSSASPRSGTAARKRWNAASTAGATWPRWASATTTTRAAEGRWGGGGGGGGGGGEGVGGGGGGGGTAPS